MARAKRIHRVAIADNRLLFRRGLKTLLATQDDIQVVAEAGSVSEITASAAALKPDVILMNMELLEQASGTETLSIRHMQSAVPTLLLAPSDDQKYLDLATASGAHSYLSKSVDPSAIVAAVRRIATYDADTIQAPQSAADLKALADTNDRWLHTSPLTRRELEILRFLAEGLTVRQTAAELNLSVKTIEAHKLNLMRKLDIHDRATLIHYATEKGIISTPAAA